MQAFAINLQLILSFINNIYYRLLSDLYLPVLLGLNTNFLQIRIKIKSSSQRLLSVLWSIFKETLYIRLSLAYPRPRLRSKDLKLNMYMCIKGIKNHTSVHGSSGYSTLVLNVLILLSLKWWKLLNKIIKIQNKL